VPPDMKDDTPALQPAFFYLLDEAATPSRGGLITPTCDLFEQLVANLNRLIEYGPFCPGKAR